MRRTPALTIVLLLLAGAPASAATVASTGDGGEQTLGYLAADGERNAVIIELAPDSVVVRDVVPLQAAGACQPVDALTARCPLPTRGVVVRLGDGDDRLDSQVSMAAFGGDGDDWLAATGGSQSAGEGGDDELIGGDRSDTLDGGPAADRQRGGGGNDSFYADDEAGRPGEDLLDGGDGLDHVSLHDQNVPVRVDLPGGSATTGGVRDALVAIENVTGGRGDDVLAGNAAANWLLGLEGQDTILGGAGDDKLEGGDGRDAVEGGDGGDDISGEGGRDRLSGGAGDDTFGYETVLPDAYACGDGRDKIAGPRPRDRVAADCELASFGLHTQDLRVIVPLGASVGRRGRLRFRVTCAEYTGRCEGGLVLKANRRGRPGVVLAQSPRRTVFTRRTRTVVLTVRPSVALRLRVRGTSLLYLAVRSRGGRPGAVPFWVRTAGGTS